MALSMSWLQFLLISFFLSTIQGANNLNGPALYRITDPLHHGECPSWDHRNNILYFVDIHVGNIHSYNYSSKEIKTINLNRAVAPVVQSKSDPDLLIVGVNTDVVAVKWDKSSGIVTNKTLVSLKLEKENSIMNDGKADKEGRIWFGTVGDEGQANFYKITRENLSNPQIIIANVSTSNGLAWNKANNKFFYIDSPTRQISVFDYNNTLGEISNGRTLLDLKKYNLSQPQPDGMTIDEDDNLWIALWEGGSVIKVSTETGNILERIAIPATYVTSVMWGGPELDVLFVTTSRKLLSDEEVAKQPYAGSVFALTNLGTKGVPVFQADIVDSI